MHVILAVGLHDEEPDAVARRLEEVREVGAVKRGNRGNLEAVANLPGLSRGGAPERVAKVRVSRGGRYPRPARRRRLAARFGRNERSAAVSRARAVHAAPRAPRAQRGKLLRPPAVVGHGLVRLRSR